MAFMISVFYFRRPSNTSRLQIFSPNCYHPVCKRSVSYQSLRRRRLGDAPHLHPGSFLLLAAWAIGAVGGAALKRHNQANGGQDENQQKNDRRQADGQQEVRGQTLRGQLEGGERQSDE